MLITLPRLPVKVRLSQGSKVLFPLALLLLGVCVLKDYLEGAMPALITGMAAIATTTGKQHLMPRRYAYATFVLLVITWLVPVKTFLYLAIATSLFFWIESCYASIHFLGIAALILSCPAFQYAAAAFGFPVRLQLTKATGAIFSAFSKGMQTKGNTIYYNGHEFGVDPACTGLHMFSLSLLLGVFLLGLLQRKTGKVISWKAAVLYLLSLFVLNLIANLLRIILLVQFAVPPGATMHDVVGLLCLLLYVCLPACYLAKAFVSKATPNKQESK